MAVGRGRMESRIFFPQDQLDAAVFFAAFRCFVVGERLQATDAHGIEPLFVHVSRDKLRLHREGPLGGESQVGVRVPGVIGVPFDAEEKVGMTLHHRNNAVDQRLRRGLEVILARLKNKWKHDTAIVAQGRVKGIIIGIDAMSRLGVMRGRRGSRVVREWTCRDDIGDGRRDDHCYRRAGRRWSVPD